MQFLSPVLFLLSHVFLYLLLLYLFLFYFFLGFAAFCCFTLWRSRLFVPETLAFFCGDVGAVEVDSCGYLISHRGLEILFTADFGLLLGFILHQAEYLGPHKSILYPFRKEHPFFVVHARIVFDSLTIQLHQLVNNFQIKLT